MWYLACEIDRLDASQTKVCTPTIATDESLHSDTQELLLPHEFRQLCDNFCEQITAKLLLQEAHQQ